jgi:phospholipase C
MAIRIRFVTAIVALATLAACGGARSAFQPASPVHRALSGSTPITHIVVLVQENRSFNDLFATFPGVTGATVGWEKVVVNSKTKRKKIKLAKIRLADKINLNHAYAAFSTAYDDGKNDAFNQIIFINNGKMEGSKPYVYVDPNDIVPYWTMASDYAIANAMFETQGSGSFTAHQDIIRGGTELTSSESMIDDPTSPAVWGCDATPGAKTSLITTSLQYKRDKGPFPCTKYFPKSGTYETLQYLLDAKTVSWKYYTPPLTKGTSGALWNAFDVIAAVRYSSEWGTNVNWPQTNIFSDIQTGNLPAVSWVIPDSNESDHPGYATDKGPSWVASVVNAIGQSSYWDTTVIVVLWDDWGGFYDPVAPKNRDNQGGPGLRVPLIAISPYTAFNSSGGSPYISNTVYGFGSVVRFIEDTFSLGSLGTTDQSSNSIADMLDFAQKPRTFQVIPAKYSRAYFLKQKASGLPVDTQ